MSYFHGSSEFSYQQLISAAPAFSVRLPSEALTEFIGFARQFYSQAGSDAELMTTLASANQQMDLISVDELARHWIPYAFHAEKMCISWCLPRGKALQPFHNEYIAHCRQHPVNALLSPITSVEHMLVYGRKGVPHPNPSGFIFHLSRCGSTLVAGCLASVANCSVLSESQLLTDVLLARNLTADERKVLLCLVMALQGQTHFGPQHYVVKWNAWDLLYWDIIRDLYPNVPTVFLIRDPVEILASHIEICGRHMSGDPALAHINPVFAWSGSSKALGHRLNVLRLLMNTMLEIQEQGRVTVCDHSNLNTHEINKIIDLFGIPLLQGDLAFISQKLCLDSKNPTKKFRDDRLHKRKTFSPVETSFIVDQTGAQYSALFRFQLLLDHREKDPAENCH